MAVLLTGCSKPSSHSKEFQVVEGKTMGTYYRITYRDAAHRDFNLQADSILQEINQQVSTYLLESTISRFNREEKMLAVPASDRHFLENLRLSRYVADLSTQLFDPTVGPLVNYWGFGYKGRKAVLKVDSAKVDSLRRLVGLANIRQEAQGDVVLLHKAFPGVELDFGGIAQGYAIDELANFLQVKGIEDYLVDLGGEFAARNLSPKGVRWQIGINIPKEDADVHAIQTLFTLEDETLSTSGNYRNFHEVDGIKYSHTINPFSGYPERNNLLSASIFGPRCAVADGLATACMTMGFDKSQLLLEYLPEYEGYFIYDDGKGGVKTYMTRNLREKQAKRVSAHEN